MLRRVLGAILFVVAAPFACFPFVHLYVLWGMWGSSQVPEHWVQNLVIAFCFGALGGFGSYEGWRIFSRRQPQAGLVTQETSR